MSKSKISDINSFSLLSPCESDLYFKLSKNTENDLAVSFLTSKYRQISILSAKNSIQSFGLGFSGFHEI